ncbi:MAG: MarR family transcriptional regulator [Odoribacteraceae bacterium]|jgi:DNA-binding MarR family transcriptional regulator|nr:MarR family transcriptional regulator [Odoribacteraceae bacterium]
MNELMNLIVLASKIDRGYTRELNRRFLQAGFPVRREQYELLRVLWEEDNVNQQTIANRLQKDKYNVTKLLNALQKRGFTRREAGEDRRNNRVVLTGKGIESRVPLVAIEEETLLDISFTLSSTEMKTGAWVLKKLKDALDK